VIDHTSTPSSHVGELASRVVMLIALFFAVLAVTLGFVFFRLDHVEHLPTQSSPAGDKRVWWEPTPGRDMVEPTILGV
jgi:hypothetical protein